MTTTSLKAWEKKVCGKIFSFWKPVLWHITLPVPLIVCFSIFSSSQIFEVNLIDKRSDKHGAPCLQVFLTSTYPTLDRQPAISDHLLGWFLSIDPSWWQDSLVSIFNLEMICSLGGSAMGQPLLSLIHSLTLNIRSFLLLEPTCWQEIKQVLP